MKTILISGAAAGIGRATAELFHRNGWQVGLTDIDQAALTATANAMGPQGTWSRVLDVTDAQAAVEVVDAFAEDHQGRIDVLFNNAGLLKTGRFEEIPTKAHAQLVNVNITGVINLSHAAHRHLRDTPGAMVVNMSSASALHGTPDLATYSATKAAIRALTEALEIEWRHDDITVRDIMPPFVDTGMVRSNASVLIDRFGVGLSAHHVAKTVWEVVTGGTRLMHNPVGWQFRLATLANDVMPSRLMHEGLRLMSRRKHRQS
ncbi:SDR family oxidoreductase [Paraliomyxa miuraensis]|uniref:SDR family oxidoreductase n=1 Tax=Paraliomyxa miuraensis TaxID=376150 RepID=UPI0022599CA3|nr:SDR family oxidoreductase [Paraliomyxa miuraensis]MCX4245189.1 SDR family oxidoreductase [Paraliomyxa miuraensis]